MVNKVAQVAIANYKKSGILPSVAVAQACYESSWGESNIARTKKISLESNIKVNSYLLNHGKIAWIIIFQAN